MIDDSGNLPKMITKCRHCTPGYRHIVGNCVLCGCGPSPLKIEPLPNTLAEQVAAVSALIDSERGNNDLAHYLLTGQVDIATIH